MSSEKHGDDWDEWRARRRERVRQAAEHGADESLLAQRRLFVSRDGHEIKRNAAGELFFVHGTRAGRSRTIHIDRRGEEHLRDHGVGEGDRLSKDGQQRLLLKGFLYTEQDGYLKPDFMQSLPGYELPEATAPRVNAPSSTTSANGRSETDRIGSSAKSNLSISERLSELERQFQRVFESNTDAIERLREVIAGNDAQTGQQTQQPFNMNFTLEITDDSAHLSVAADEDDVLSYPFVVDAPSESDPLYTIYSEADVDGNGVIQSFLETRTFADAIRELFALVADTIIESLEFEADE